MLYDARIVALMHLRISLRYAVELQNLDTRTAGVPSSLGNFKPIVLRNQLRAKAVATGESFSIWEGPFRKVPSIAAVSRLNQTEETLEVNST
jgi:hypothetical protein